MRPMKTTRLGGVRVERATRSRRVAVGIAVLAVVFSTAAIAVAARNPFDKPEPGLLTVESLPPGADYKSLPAAPEAVETAGSSDAAPMSLSEARATYDPDDDPDILLCQRKDGGFRIELIDRAPPGVAKPVPPPNGQLTEDPFAGMTDNGPCNET